MHSLIFTSSLALEGPTGSQGTTPAYMNITHHLIAVLQISKNDVPYISTSDISIWFIKYNPRLILE